MVEAGFKYGLSVGSLSSTEVGTYNNGSISANLNGLTAGTTYYYQAYVTVKGTGNYATQSTTFTGSVRNFKTSDAEKPKGWLELPAAVSKNAIGSTTTSSLNSLEKHTHYLNESARVGSQRNYTFLYDPEMYASYWVAYPLTQGHMGDVSRPTQFPKDPSVDADKQTDIEDTSYRVDIETPNYQGNYYARGHQIPNADRDGNAIMQRQTFYATNVTPQIQYGFNGGIWDALEAGIRAAVPSSTADSLYIVTGASFKKVGGSETITTIRNANDNKILPVPNYYWKVVLKVKWGSGGTIVNASAIGFWLPHADLKDKKYADYAVSVDQIETWTGFDFFTNLPGSMETFAERNTSWTTFQNF